MAFGPSERTRRKVTDAAAALLEPGTHIRAVGFGRANARWTTTSIVLLAVFASVFLVALALGVLLFPGAVLLIVFSQKTWPPRVVVVADQGVATMDRGLLNGRPARVVARLPHAALATPAGSDRKRQLGYDVVTFPLRELERLVGALPQPSFVAP
jgi:hypothetical protein